MHGTVVREEHGFPYKIKIIVYRSLGQEELLVVLKNLKILNIPKDFIMTLPDHRRDSYNSIMGDKWEEEIKAIEEQEIT